MAVIKPGSLVADIRGKVGDNVFSRGQGGASVRSVGTWNQPDTDAQQLTRLILETLAQAWSDLLSEPNRNAWRTYAHRHPRPNRWGTPTQTSGYLAFIRGNFHAYRQAAAIVFPSAPTAPPLHPPHLQVTVQQNGALLLTGSLTPDVTGYYHPLGQSDGHPTWKHITLDPPYYICNDATSWRINLTIPSGLGPRWAARHAISDPFQPYGGAIGIANAAWSYNASLARITFPPDNYDAPPAQLQIYTHSGIPLKSGRSYYSGPWRHLKTFTPPNPATTDSLWFPWTWPVHATGDPYIWTPDGTDSTRLSAIAQDMDTGAISTKHKQTPNIGSLSPW